MPILTERQLQGINPPASHAQVAAWIAPLRDAMAAHGINSTIERMAGFLASVANETNFLRSAAEIGWYGTPWKRAKAMFGHACPTQEVYETQKKALGEHGFNVWFFDHVYDDRIRGKGWEIGGNVNDGDGWKYRARGPGITGRNNYRVLGERLGIDLENNPDLLLDPAVAAPAFASYWTSIGNNERMDRGDFRGAMLAMNGGLKDSDLVQHDAHHARALSVLRTAAKESPETATEAAKQVATGKTGAAAAIGAGATAITVANTVSTIGEAQGAATATKGFLATIGLPSPWTEIVLGLLTVGAIGFVAWRYGRKLLRGEAVST